MSIYKGCPYCCSSNFTYMAADQFRCSKCGALFEKPEVYSPDENCCPECKSANTAYYNSSDLHHYCNNCGHRW